MEHNMHSPTETVTCVGEILRTADNMDSRTETVKWESENLKTRGMSFHDDYQDTNKKASRHENDPFDLRNRFVVKQKEVYARALSEIKAGRKSRCIF